MHNAIIIVLEKFFQRQKMQKSNSLGRQTKGKRSKLNEMTKNFYENSAID